MLRVIFTIQVVGWRKRDIFFTNLRRTPVSKLWSIDVATEEEIHFFIDRVEALLEAKGIKVDHAAFREVLKKAGAGESAKGYITFPRELQRESLALAPRSFRLDAVFGP